MRIIRNERHIRVRSFIGLYVPLIGMGVLAVSWILSIKQVLWSALTLPVGFICVVVGGFFADRYAGRLAHHTTLAGILKGLDDRYALFNYVLPVSHVLLEPSGCTVLVVKTHGGEVTFQENGRWKHQQRGKLFRQLAGQEAVGVPELEAEIQVQKLKRWLSNRLPDSEIPVRGVVVFANPDLTLEAEAAPVPTLHGKRLKAWLRGPGRLKQLQPEVYQQLTETLGTRSEQER